MATWIAHMRVAEYLMKKYDKLNTNNFLVGNIGPDCGVPNEDWSSFTPNKNITHWFSEDGKNIDADDFKNNYLNIIDEKYSFYLGYYFHLLTDIEWLKLYNRKKLEPLYYENLNKDKNFIWTIKKDWYGQDHLFLRNNPNFIFYTMFSNITEFNNIFFDFFPKEAFIRQIKYITDFYLSSKEDSNRNFPYLSTYEMDNFVNETISILVNIFDDIDISKLA